MMKDAPFPSNLEFLTPCDALISEIELGQFPEKLIALHSQPLSTPGIIESYPNRFLYRAVRKIYHWIDSHPHLTSLLKRVLHLFILIYRNFKSNSKQTLNHSGLSERNSFAQNSSLAKSSAFETLLGKIKTPQDPTVLRILVCVPWIDRGGSSHHLSAVLSKLKDQGFQFSILATHPERRPDLWNGYDLYEAFSDQIFDLHQISEEEFRNQFFQTLLGRLKPNIVLIVGSRFVYERTEQIKHILPECKIIDHLYNTEGHIANNREFEKFIDFNIVANSDVENKLCELGESPTKIQVIFHGIDTARFSPEKMERSRVFSGDQPIFGFIGRFSDEKRPVDFLQFLREKPEALGLMCGSGPLKPDLLIKSVEWNLSSRLLFCAPKDCFDFYRMIDFLIIPSAIEGLPLVLLEAMALEIPCIATRVGAIPDVIDDGVDGYLYESGQLKHLLEKTNSIIKLDFEKLSFFKKKARAKILEKFDLELCAQSYHQTFRKVHPAHKLAQFSIETHISGKNDPHH